MCGACARGSWSGRLTPLLPAAVGAQETEAPCQSASYRQFDFWLGEWDVLNIQRRPEGTQWGITGRATDRVYAVASGCGIVEHWRGSTATGRVLGYSLRAWNPEKKQWDLVLLWPQPNQPLFFTLEGSFRHERGDFSRSGTDPAGNRVETRFTFSDIGPRSLRWNNGTSRDGGRTWSTTWIMEFTRRDSLADPMLNGPTQTRDRCTFPEIHGMDAWLGDWEGEAILAAGDTVPARARSYEILDGCAQMDFVELGEGEAAAKVYRVRTYQPDLKRWVEYRLDDRYGMIEHLEGSVDGASALLETPDNTEGHGRQVRTRWTRLTADRVDFETAVRSASGAWTRLWSVTLRRLQP